MKPYQILKIDSAVDLSIPRETTVQLNFLEGGTREPKLGFTPLNKTIAGKYQKFEVDHEKPTKKSGITTFIYDGLPHELTFSKFITPEKFNAYYDESENIIIFSASKEICKSARKYLNKAFHFDLQYVDFDFAKASNHIESYQGAWFKQLSPELRAAALFGPSVDDNEYFKDFCVSGLISNVIIHFPCEHRIHQVMITQKSGIVLIDNYNNNDDIELGIISYLYSNIIKPTWNS